MEERNSAAIPIMANLKLTNQTDERKVYATLYKQIIVSLRYICNRRLNISYGVRLVSRLMNDPRQSQFATAKHILRYLKGTTNYDIFFPKKSGIIDGVLEAWCDLDLYGDKVDRKSTCGYLFKYMGAPISSCSKKQKVVAFSSCEAEYIASIETTCQCVWLETIFDELKLEHKRPVQLLVDNKFAISLSKNLFHGRSKHIETKFHFLRDQVDKRRLKLIYCCTEDQATDVFIKALKLNRFEKLRDLLSVKLIENSD